MGENELHGINLAARSAASTQANKQKPLESFFRNNVWVFNSAGPFSGNVKYLFLYVVKHRPDIYACYLSGNQRTVNYIRSLGYNAHTFISAEGQYVMSRAGVYVSDQVKEHIQDLLINCKYLNLFHGVGLKKIERKIDNDLLNRRIAKKYIRYNEYFIRNMLFLATSPFMERHFQEQLALDESQIIRGGYPRNLYPAKYNDFKSYEHDLRKIKGLSSDAKIVLYAPTYREDNVDGFLSVAIPDFPRLISKLKAANMLLIIKLHDRCITDHFFQGFAHDFGAVQNILIWDNSLDVYEVLNQIDLCIYDYSSIFYDFLEHGIKHYIRYIFDQETYKSLIYDYDRYTTGKICTNFDELLSSLENYSKFSSPKQADAKINQLRDEFWSYSKKDSLNDIVNQTLAASIRYNINLPTLYSFDIFDTLICRKCLAPEGIFYGIRDRISKSDCAFPKIFADSYPNIRKQAEENVRELRRKTLHLDPNHWEEILFDQIFERIREVYELDDRQIALLKTWEIELELENVQPIMENIGRVRKLLSKKQQIILISDMYLPAEIVRRLLRKVDSELENLPLFVSSEKGKQKTTGNLFIEAYKSFDFYNFRSWKHFGDNTRADISSPRSLSIETQKFDIPCFNQYERALISSVDCYDAYLIAGIFARYRASAQAPTEYFAFAYISLYLVPYISWVLRDAIKHGYQKLYFISRDGYFLKRIADLIISQQNLPIATKYIYGSRKAWRVPSFIDEIDDDFYGDYGNLKNIRSFKSLLESLYMDEYDFTRVFPGLAFLAKKDKLTAQDIQPLVPILKGSNGFQAHLLERAAQERELVCAYLRQEIDAEEKYAFVEYWARGYTQDCMTRLMHSAFNNDQDVPYYYFRSILPTEGRNIRRDYTTNTNQVIFVESIFANMPHGTISGYTKYGTEIIPIFEEQNFDRALFAAMERGLDEFIKRFYALPFLNDVEYIERKLSDFGLEWFRDHQDDRIFAECLAPLKDGVAIHEDLAEYAPAFDMRIIKEIAKGAPVSRFTKSLPMSLTRTSPNLRQAYNDALKDSKRNSITAPAPEDPLWLQEKSLNLLEQGQPIAAAIHTQKALKNNPTLAWAYACLAKKAEAENNPEEVERQLRKAVLADPHNVSYMEKLAYFLKKNGDDTGASDLARQALREDPNQGWAYIQLSRWHEARNELDEAIDMRKKAVQASPNQLWYRKHLASMLFNQKRFDEAAEVAREALQLNENQGWAYIQLSRWHDARNELDEAIATRMRAMQLDPEETWYGKYLQELLKRKEGQCGAAGAAK